MLHPIVSWIVSIMMFVSPPDRMTRVVQFPGWEETVEQRRDRYEEIAESLYQVAFDSEEKPAFGGARGRSETAALLLAVAFHESGFAKDVDLGPCYRGKDGKRGRCDGGLSACLMQLRLGSGSTIEGWSQDDLFSDRKKCFRSGLNLIRRSMKSCRELPLEHRLNAYASGTCRRGHSGSHGIMSIFRRMLDRSPVLWLDTGFILRKDTDTSGELSILALPQ